MKFFAKILLFLFVAFLATPTVVGMIEKSCDTSVFYSMSEEELSHKEVKAELRLSSFEFLHLGALTKSPIHAELESKHDNVAGTIFIPPPEQV